MDVTDPRWDHRVEEIDRVDPRVDRTDRMDARWVPRVEEMDRVDPREDKTDRLDPREDPRTEARLDPRLDPMLDPRADPRVDPRLDPRADPRADPRLDPSREGLRVDPLLLLMLGILFCSSRFRRSMPVKGELRRRRLLKANKPSDHKLPSDFLLLLLLR